MTATRPVKMTDITDISVSPSDWWKVSADPIEDFQGQALVLYSSEAALLADANEQWCEASTRLHDACLRLYGASPEAWEVSDLTHAGQLWLAFTPID